jgi:AcrR family transcriptional regulator
MNSRTFVRARRPEQKQQRREAILAAARDLALRDGVRNVTLGSVAAAVGLAKSNVVRYFGTREEIFLVLAVEEMRAWAEALTERLRAAAKPAEMTDALVETIVTRPLLCDLAGNISTSLEHNVSVPAARAFKTTSVELVAELGARFAEAYRELTPGEGRELIGGVIGYAGVLYPSEHPPPTLAALYEQEPEVAARCVMPFEPTLRRLVNVLVAGLIATRDG